MNELPEPHVCKYEADIIQMRESCKLIGEIYHALLGHFNGQPGLLERQRSMEKELSFMKKRGVYLRTWMTGIFSGVIVGVLLIIAQALTGVN